MGFLLRNKLHLIALMSLGLAVCGLYSAWFVKYELGPAPSVEKVSRAVRTDGTVIEMKGMGQMLTAQRDGQIQLTILLGIFGLGLGIYLLRNGYKLAWISSVVSIASIVLGAMLMLGHL